MSDAPSPPPPRPEPPPVIPVHYLPDPYARRPRGRGCLITVLLLSLLFNLLIVVAWITGGGDESDGLTERFYSGDKEADDKVAIVRIDGLLMEGMLDYEFKQIERAAKDDAVKAVVVRIDSPGGTIGASEELHKRLVWLREGTSPLFEGSPKPLVASMGAIAASGGYYVAMPASPVLAEKTTLTGSIGVYASFPNVSELGEKIGFKMELIKAGRIKASGSPFHPMSPQERQPWQEMVNQAYDQFLDVVAAGRPDLAQKELWTEPLFEKQIPLHTDQGNVVVDEKTGEPKTVTYSRYRADGGIFTAADAKKYGLIDRMGDLPDAVQAAAEKAQISQYRAVTYDRPESLMDALLGVRAESPAALLDADRLARSLRPQVWYLTPQSDLSALLAPLVQGDASR